MTKVKLVAGLVTIVGIATLTVCGASEVAVGTYVTIGIGAGTVIAAIVALLKKQ